MQKGGRIRAGGYDHAQMAERTAALPGSGIREEGGVHVLIMMTGVKSDLLMPRLPLTPPRQTGGALRSALMLLMGVALMLAGLAAWWVTRPLPLRGGVAVEFSVEQGSTPRDVARGWVEAGVEDSDWLLFQWFRVSGQARQIRAGSYELPPGSSARDLLR